VAAAATAGFALRKRFPVLALAFLWFLGGQVIESSSVMLELYFEHRNYTPSIGLFLACAIAIGGMKSERWRQLSLAGAGAWIFMCTLVTGLSARVYASEDKLAAVWSSQHPASIRAQSMLANQLYLHGNIPSALQIIDNARSIHPLDTGLAQMQLFFNCALGKTMATEVSSLQQLFLRAPWSAGGFHYTKQLRILAQAGHCKVFGVGEWKNLVDAMLANPAYTRNGVSAGFLHYQLSELAVAQGDLDAAITGLQAAYRRDPDADIPRVEAKYLASAGLYGEAITVLQTTDYTHLPLLRRWLVNDRAINSELIEILRAEQEKSQIGATH
jgi:hypothetical protein